MKFAFGIFVAALCFVGPLKAEDRLRVLFVTGSDPHGHRWQETTPLLEKIFKETGRFAVETAPVSSANAADFHPDFNKYDVVVLVAHGAAWPKVTYEALETRLKKGGGLVVIHNACGAFSDWPQYRRTIGIGPGNQKAGFRLKFDETKNEIVRVKPGEGITRNGHGRQHAWVVTIRRPEHPITAGLPTQWIHTNDELYHGLRGPVEEVEVLATAFSSRASGGTGDHEPVALAIRYGEGRVFHTTLGHSTVSMSCAGFQTIIVRGAEWAATGKVTLTKCPDDFPKADQVSARK